MRPGTMPSELGDVPIPFRARDLPRAVRDDARALWDWFDVSASLHDPLVWVRTIETGGVPEAHFTTWGHAVDACRSAGLDRDLLLSRPKAAARLLHASGPVFDDGADLDRFASGWCGDHARLLAALAGLKGSWQLRMAEELARGFFLTGSVIGAPKDLATGRILFPRADLDRFGVTAAELLAGSYGPGVRRLLWKQAVRARDALARGRELIEEMPFLMAWRARRYWFGALELLVRAEKTGWDVWSRPQRITPFFRFRVDLMSVAGRTVFRGR